jgi:hypothetical protein
LDRPADGEQDVARFTIARSGQRHRSCAFSDPESAEDPFMPIKFDERQITAGSGGDLGGAVFTLAAPAGADAEFTTAGGEDVSIAEHSKGVLVTGVEAADPAAAWRKGLVAAQQGLDLFSARGIVDLQLSEPQFEHLLVYGEAGSQVLRVVGVSTLNITIPPVKVKVTDAGGNPVPQPAPISVWHESMRYYRQAELSDDLFDSLRNLWLAFENLLDSFEPQRAGEREKAWLKRALGLVDGAFGLAQFLPPGSSGNLVDAAYAYFYDEVRTHLFHAKASRRPLLPREQSGTNLLVDRHRHLTDLYLRLLEHVTGVRRLSGAMMKAGFDLMMQGLESAPVVLLTDDDAPGDPDAGVINPNGGVLLEAAAVREPALESPFERVFLARFGSAEVAGLQRLRRLAFKADGTMFTAHVIEGELEISGVGALEAQMGMRLRNASLPKAFAEM